MHWNAFLKKLSAHLTFYYQVGSFQLTHTTTHTTAQTIGLTFGGTNALTTKLTTKLNSLVKRVNIFYSFVLFKKFFFFILLEVSAMVWVVVWV